MKIVFPFSLVLSHALDDFVLISNPSIALGLPLVDDEVVLQLSYSDTETLRSTFVYAASNHVPLQSNIAVPGRVSRIPYVQRRPVVPMARATTMGRWQWQYLVAVLERQCRNGWRSRSPVGRSSIHDVDKCALVTLCFAHSIEHSEATTVHKLVSSLES